jgi:carboxypeptidase Q
MEICIKSVNHIIMKKKTFTLYLKTTLFILLLTIVSRTNATENDSLMVDKIFHEALSDYEAYNNLRYLCKNIGGRIGGSPQAAAAVEFTYQIMQNMQFDSVFRQPTMVAVWQRGNAEKAKIVSALAGQFDVNVCALGGSPSTGTSGLMANVIEIRDIEELEKFDRKLLKDKIIFFNKPFSHHHYYTFRSYSEVARNRFHGPKIAAEIGAAAVIVRSMTHDINKNTHTGVTGYRDVENPVPSFAISTYHANLLSDLLKQDPRLNLYLESHCQLFEDTKSYNVIGEITGSKYPNRIITVGSHLDAWDNGEGAHDSGVGCIQSIEIARLFFKLGIKPKNTIRIVMFMDEEMNQRGARTYAEEIIRENDKHYFALESDRGGLTPIGFTIDTESDFIEKMQNWFPLLKHYGVYQMIQGFSGVDINQFKKHEIPLAGLLTDSQRYFDYQHSEADTFEAVNRREMQLGSAAMACLIYFVDKYGY